MQRVNPILLEINSDIEVLALRYVKEGIIPEKYSSDALHIAVASFYGLSVLVSWNFRHIVKLKTKRMVNGVNRLLGYPEIEICSPEEVIES